MSVEMRPRDYWESFNERRAVADLGELFAAHDSTAFHNLVLLRHDLGHDRADRREARPETQSSLDSCEKVSRDPQNPAQSGDSEPRIPTKDVVSDAENRSILGEQSEISPDLEKLANVGSEGGDSCDSSTLGSEDRGGTVGGSDSSEPPGLAGYSSNSISRATSALRAGLSRSRARQRRIIEMIGVGEVAHARRFATCQQKSTQLQCTLCGSKDNYVPITCDSRLCETCMNRLMGQKNQKYGDVVASMESGTFGTFTIENVGEIETGVEAIRGAFGRLRQRTIPTSGTVTRENDDGELVTIRWVWKQADDEGEPADYYWKSALCAAGKQELARYLQKHYVNQGKQIPWSELVKGGLYGIDIKEQEEGCYHIHLHTLMDSAFIPQAALSSVWEDLTGAPVIDLRRGDRGALDDVVGYVCKPPEFETLDAEIEYLTTVKGSPLIQPFGNLHGNTPEIGGLLRCAHCDDVPLWWDYLGIVDGCYDTMTPNWEEDGDRPPPKESAG